MRLRRKELGMSQSDLAKACSITFQQVQKYEYGTNRISFSRLVEMSEALECSVGDLIGNLDTSKSSGAFSKNVSNLVETGATELMKAYAGIGSPQQTPGGCQFSVSIGKRAGTGSSQKAV